MRIRSLLLLACACVTSVHADESKVFNIQSQSLAKALLDFSAQSNVVIMAPGPLLEGKQAPAVSGSMPPLQALEQLLRGTGLISRINDKGAVVITAESVTGANVRDAGSARLQMAQLETTEGSERETTSREREAASERAEMSKSVESASDSAREFVALSEITVTGSRIKGARPSSMVLTITPEDMRLAGQNNLGEVIRAIPQNFNGGQNPSVAFNTGGDPANTNISGASSINLRGLGPDATLVLLNGSRLPYDGVAQAVDVSVIPTAAIERVEVLLDGASAIYGSDAVGGVANIQLKRDYDGAELSVRYGEATDGGFVQNQYSGVIGTTWESGGFLVAGDSSGNTAIRARQRDYLAYMPNRDYTIYPQLQQESALLSGHQQLGASVEFTLDAFYTDRQQDMMYQLANLIRQQRNSTLWGITPALRFQLPADWSARVHGALGENDFELHQKDFNRTTGVQLARYGSRYANDSQAAGIEAEGPLFALPAGTVRLSVGGGYRRNELEVMNLITQVKGTHGSDRSRYGYGEIDVPLVSPSQAVPMVEHFSINGAVRYENYDSFGETTTPKFGINWGVVPGVELKANWGKSFKVPTLYQQNAIRNLVLYPGTVFGAASTDIMMLSFGGAPDLQPERAEIITAGISWTPTASLALEAGWFDIDYKDRVVAPLPYTAQALNDVSFSDFVTFDPSVAEQNALFAEMGLPAGTFTSNFSGAPYDPSNIYALLRNHYANAASQRIGGVDVMARYTHSLFGGTLATSLSATWIDSHRRLSSGAPEQPAAGRVFYVSKFKARVGASWSRDALTVASYVSHIDGVDDTRIAPTVSGASWTTVDLVFDYQLQSAMFDGIGINLAVTNLFNRAPPSIRHLIATDVSYDSTNYSPLGRVWNATLTKRF